MSSLRPTSTANLTSSSNRQVPNANNHTNDASKISRLATETLQSNAAGHTQLPETTSRRASESTPASTNHSQSTKIPSSLRTTQPLGYRIANDLKITSYADLTREIRSQLRDTSFNFPDEALSLPGHKRLILNGLLDRMRALRETGNLSYIYDRRGYDMKKLPDISKEINLTKLFENATNTEFRNNTKNLKRNIDQINTLINSLREKFLENNDQPFQGNYSERYPIQLEFIRSYLNTSFLKELIGETNFKAESFKFKSHAEILYYELLKTDKPGYKPSFRNIFNAINDKYVNPNSSLENVENLWEEFNRGGHSSVSSSSTSNRNNTSSSSSSSSNLRYSSSSVGGKCLSFFFYCRSSSCFVLELQFYSF